MGQSLTDETSIPLLSGEEWLEAIEFAKNLVPLPTPFQGFIPPFYRGRTTTLGAETEVGKTVFGLQAFKWVADHELSCAYCTLEMTPADLFERFQHQFESPEECKAWIEEHNVHVSEPYADAHEVERIIRQGFDFVVIDHIHELPFDGHEDLGRKVKRLASLAPATNTSILMLSQMKQPDPEFRRPPTKYDYAWSKSIAEVSSVLLALWKEDDTDERIEMYNLKNRFGSKYDSFPVELDKQTVTLKLAI